MRPGFGISSCIMATALWCVLQCGATADLVRSAPGAELMDGQPWVHLADLVTVAAQPADAVPFGWALGDAPLFGTPGSSATQAALLGTEAAAFARRPLGEMPDGLWLTVGWSMAMPLAMPDTRDSEATVMPPPASKPLQNIIPEPGAMGLWSVGAVCLAIRRRMRVFRALRTQGTAYSKASRTALACRSR